MLLFRNFTQEYEEHIILTP